MYRVHLQAFEGPLDLLLFFIQRDELDIYDIPIARIADEFLEYVRVMNEVDLDGVGDFIYMAALLIGIKAKMLLPVPEVDEEGEAIDPRRELVERLLEYVRYKEAARTLGQLEEARQRHFGRGAGAALAQVAALPAGAVLDVTLFDLVTALRRVLTEAAPQEEPTHAVRRFEYTVEMQQEFVRAQLAAERRVSFVALVRARPRGFILVTFLAVLELVRQGEVRVRVGERPEDFVLERRALPAAEEV